MTTFPKLATAAVAVAIIVVAGMAFILGGRGGVASTPASSAAAGAPGLGATATAPGPSPVASDGATARVPGGFTACVPSNTQLRAGTDERIVVPHPDGDMTLERRRGFTWSGVITATDERFSGTHYYSFDDDGYTLVSGEPGPRVVAEGHRIENDEGAWQGWSMGAGLSEDSLALSPAFLTGEGAYAGLTAILFVDEGTCSFNFMGIVIDVPEPPVPTTGE
jgi:hypothetical protein